MIEWRGLPEPQLSAVQEIWRATVSESLTVETERCDGIAVAAEW